MNSYDFFRNSEATNFNGSILHLYVGIKLKPNNGSIYVKHKNSIEKIIYETKNSSIHDLSVIKKSSADDSEVKIIWRENVGVSSKSEIHYAEMSDELEIIRHTVIELNSNYILPVGVLVEGYLLISGVSSSSNKAEVSAYDSISLEKVIVNTEIDSALHLNYFSDKQSYLANITLTPIDNNRTFLQFVSDSGTIRTYQIDVKNNSLIINRLFDFAYENIGFHRVLLDKEKSVLLLVYSEDIKQSHTNNIMIAKQDIFKSDCNQVYKTSKRVSTQVNQSVGEHYRPYIIKNAGDYFVAWEGSSLLYISLDDEFNIVIPESNVKLDAPGNVIAIKGEGLTLSCQTSNLEGKDSGKSISINEV